MLEPVVLPREYESYTIKDMAPGEVAYINPSGMKVNSSGRCFLETSSLVSPVPFLGYEMRIELREYGFWVDLKESGYSWKRQVLPYSEVAPVIGFL